LRQALEAATNARALGVAFSYSVPVTVCGGFRVLRRCLIVRTDDPLSPPQS
jgi:hypothetical protein